LIRPKTAAKENTVLIDPRTRELSHIAELIAKDIFRRLDKIEINNIIEFDEYQELYSRINENVTMSDYKKVLNEYCHNGEGGLSRRGFLEMFKDLALNNQSKAWKLLKAWGYDEDLYPVEARTFMLTTHSMNLI